MSHVVRMIDLLKKEYIESLLVPPTQDSECSAYQVAPMLFSFNCLTDGPGSLSLVLGPFKGLPAD